MKNTRTLIWLTLLSGLVSVNNVLAQNDALSIQTEVPSTVSVCQDNFTFTIDITNTSSNIAESVVLRPEMPPGIVYLNVIAGGDLSALPEPNNPAIELGDIASGGTVQVVYEAKATCEVIDFILQNNPGQSSGLVYNLTQADFEINGSSYVSEEENGSDSYNVIYPDLNVSFSENQSYNLVKPESSYTRTYEIQNGGIGRVSAITVDINHAPGISIFGTDKGTLVAGATGATITLGPADFSLIGNEDGFLDAEEVISITETVLVEGCDVNQSDYDISWGCNMDICQHVLIAAGTTINGGTPDLGSSIITNIPTFYSCPETGVFTVEFTNNGLNIEDVARNVVLRNIHDEGLYSFQEFTINGVNFGTLMPEVTSTVNSNANFGGLLEVNYYSFDNLESLEMDPDGPGGLEDLDMDGYFDDLAVGSTLVIEIHYLLAQIHEGECPVDDKDRIVHFTLISENHCDDLFSVTASSLQVDFESNGAGITSGPPNLLNSQAETYSFTQPFRVDNDVPLNQPFSDDLNLQAFIVLPEGIKLSGTGVYVDGIPTTSYTQSNNTVFIDAGAYQLNTSSGKVFSIDLMLDCELTETGPAILEWGEQLTRGCEEPIIMGCATQEILKHCDDIGDGDGDCLRTTGFNVERTSLGFTDETMSTRVSADDPGIFLDRAYECDTICALATSVFVGDETTNATIRIEYNVPETENLLSFVSATVEVFDSSTSTLYSSDIAPTITNDQMDPTKYYLDFNADDLIQSELPNQVISLDDNVNLKVIFTISKSEQIPLGIYELPEFRATHFTDISGTTISCDTWAARLNILKAELSHVSNFSDDVPNRILGAIFPCGEIKCQITSIIKGGLGISDDFPNEFRPYLNWDDEMVFSLPEVVNYTSGALLQYPSETIPPSSEDVINNVVTVNFDSPILERHEQIRRVAYVKGSLNCNPPSPNLFYVSTSYTEYAHSEDPACQEIVVLDNLDYSFAAVFPLHTIDASPALQDGYESEISWNVEVCVGSRFSNNNSFVFIENPSGNIDLQSVTQDDGVTQQILDAIPTVGGVFVALNPFPQLSCTNLIVTASNTNCIEGAMDSLKVMTGYYCGTIPEINSEMCFQDTVTLFLNPQEAGFQAEYVLPESSDLCEIIPFEVEGTSTRPANMDNLEFYTSLPSGVNLLPGATIQYPLSEPPQLLPMATDLYGPGTLGWDLSLVPGLENGLIGIRDPTKNKFIIRFNVEATCDFDPSDVVEMNLSGTTNCGELIELPAQYNIEINGFPILDNLLLEANATSCSCPDDVYVEVLTTNIGVEPTSNDGYLNVILPVGASYITGSATPDPNQQTLNDGSTLIEWPLTQGLLMGETEQRFFQLNVSESICDSFELSFSSIIRKEIQCSDSTSNCPLTATTATTTTGLTNFAPDATITANGPTTFCEGESVELTTAGVGLIEWSTSEFTNSITVSTSGIYVVTVTDPMTGCSSNDTIEVVVHPKPVPAITIDPLSDFCIDGFITLLGIGGGTYEWSTSEETQNLEISSPGLYELMVTSAFDCVGTTNIDVGLEDFNCPSECPTPCEVFPAFVWNMLPINSMDGCCLEFSNNSAGNTFTSITSYLWDFGDGSSSTIEDPDHCYQSPGNHNVSLTVTGESESGTCTSTFTWGVLCDCVDSCPCDLDGDGLAGASDLLVFLSCFGYSCP